MRHFIRICRGCCHAAVLAAVSSPLGAAPASDWSTTVAATSDYLFRGLSQTDHGPALQAGVTYSSAAGFHASAWGSNVSWLADQSSSAAPVSNRLELDGDAGWHWPLGSAVGLDAGLHTYVYPGSYPRGFTSPDTTEAYLALNDGDWSITYSHALTNLFGIAHSRHSSYWDVAWAHALDPYWSLFAHLGHQRVRDVANASYRDWNAGIRRRVGTHLSLAFGYYDSDADSTFYRNSFGHELGRGAAVISASAQW